MKVNFYGVHDGYAYRSVIALLSKVLQQSKTVLVVSLTEEKCQMLSDMLWRSSIWLPHCFYGAFAQEHNQIVLTHDVDNIDVKQYDFLLIHQYTLHNYLPKEKIFVVFDIQDPMIVEYNKKYWQQLKDDGYEVVFYQKGTNAGFQESSLW